MVQYKNWEKNPVDNFILLPNPADLREWHVLVCNLAEPFAHGEFLMQFQIGADFPERSPKKLIAITPNGVFENDGQPICISIGDFHDKEKNRKDNWRSAMGIAGFAAGVASAFTSYKQLGHGIRIADQFPLSVLRAASLTSRAFNKKYREALHLQIEEFISEHQSAPVVKELLMRRQKLITVVPPVNPYAAVPTPDGMLTNVGPAGIVVNQPWNVSIPFQKPPTATRMCLETAHCGACDLCVMPPAPPAGPVTVAPAVAPAFSLHGTTMLVPTPPAAIACAAPAAAAAPSQTTVVAPPRGKVAVVPASVAVAASAPATLQAATANPARPSPWQPAPVNMGASPPAPVVRRVARAPAPAAVPPAPPAPAVVTVAPQTAPPPTPASALVVVAPAKTAGISTATPPPTKMPPPAAQAVNAAPAAASQLATVAPNTTKAAAAVAPIAIAPPTIAAPPKAAPVITTVGPRAQPRVVDLHANLQAPAPAQVRAVDTKTAVDTKAPAIATKAPAPVAKAPAPATKAPAPATKAPATKAPAVAAPVTKAPAADDDLDALFSEVNSDEPGPPPADATDMDAFIDDLLE